jgi:hypothetical protein
VSGKEYYPVFLELDTGFGNADTEDIDVEATSFEEACRKSYDEWAPTGWTYLTVWDIGRTRSKSFDLSLPYEEGTEA